MSPLLTLSHKLGRRQYTKLVGIQVEDTIAQMLDDSIVMTQSMGFSPFKAPFAERIAAWDAKLRLVSDTLEAWIQVCCTLSGFPISLMNPTALNVLLLAFHGYTRKAAFIFCM